MLRASLGWLLIYINQFLIQCKFKYEGLNLISSLFRAGNFVFSFDLKSGYHHVDIHKQFQPYLGFSWGDGCKRRFITFGCFSLVCRQPAMSSPSYLDY